MVFTYKRRDKRQLAKSSFTRVLGPHLSSAFDPKWTLALTNLKPVSLYV
jgi:hypothetical protein